MGWLIGAAWPGGGAAGGEMPGGRTSHEGTNRETDAVINVIQKARKESKVTESEGET